MRGAASTKRGHTGPVATSSQAGGAGITPPATTKLERSQVMDITAVLEELQALRHEMAQLTRMVGQIAEPSPGINARELARRYAAGDRESLTAHNERLRKR